MRAEQSWSLLDPKPVLVYLAHHDDYIVYWNGIAMTHSQALCMAMEISANIYATPEMKTALEKNFEKLYYANAFVTRAWDAMIADSGYTYDKQKRWMQEHLARQVKDRPAAEVLGWFDYSRARKEENVQDSLQRSRS